MALQPWLVRTIAGAMFVIVLALLFAVSDPKQAAALLFVVPVALLALSGGMRGGLGGAAIATVLVAVWVVVNDVGLNVIGWSSRIAAFVVIGVLVGRYEDLARAYERRQIDEKYAAELHDRVVQALVVARYKLTDHPEAQREIDAALEGAKHIISTRLGDVRPGDLRVTGTHPVVPPPERRDH